MLYILDSVFCIAKDDRDIEIYYSDNIDECSTTYLAKEFNALSGDVLELIPGEWLTEAMCLKAVSDNGLYLSSVPEDMRTYEVCLTAVKHDGFALRWVPKELCTDEIFAEADAYIEKLDQRRRKYWYPEYLAIKESKKA